MERFTPPPFRPHRLIRGGHLQTLISIRNPKIRLQNTRQETVVLPDGDAIVLHWDQPSPDRADSNRHRDESPSRGVMLMIHGLSGCHGSPYMIRLADRFVRGGFTVVRMDMRGCGAARNLARHLSHAGRSEDIRAALDHISQHAPGVPLHALGVSLGGNQLLRLVGRIGSGLESQPDWFGSLAQIAAVAPPINLLRCSENMQRSSRRLYNWYFIRQLFQRMPDPVKNRLQELPDLRSLLRGPRPRTLFELDDRLTAPLSGFAGADEYYQACGAFSVVQANPVRTLVLAAEDDPIVPVDCFTGRDVVWPGSTQLVVSASGGHAGYIGRGGEFWMDSILTHWFGVA